MSSIIIPVKNLKAPKTRLSPILNLGERRRLATAMFQDVLQSAQDSRLSEHILVVSSDDRIIRVSEEAGVQFFQEKAQKGVNEAICKGIDLYKRQGVDAVLIIPADIPLVKSEDLDAILEVSRDFDIVICPCKDIEGTNALALKSLHILYPRYGGGSFIKHVKEAEEAGASYRILWRQNIALDIDLPKDLVDLYRVGSTTHTTTLLEEFQFHKRVEMFSS